MADPMYSSENPIGNLNDGVEECDENCAFCIIANGACPDTDILFDDGDIVCFQDIDPGATHHYLVIPKKHIHSCKSLEADDISLVKKMAEIGRQILKEKNVTNFEDISLGFHVPPFITVPHLHLHVLAPFSQLSKGVENMIQILEKKKGRLNIKLIKCLPSCI
ncbi:adenosine 5'-monophosphoramidase HINT3 isoform X2 [Paramisgurnus dabryanus]|uniref:adenosine 5'-monophosphoramidase HINT3 isoform X2 n=1 Tax=Paramisgurnus dabryanus TaxID=90735 RepID=UPI0031F362A0